MEDPQALEIFGSYGASVDKNSRIVKLPAGIVEDAICSAPEQVMLAGRNPDRDILLEDNKNAFVNFSSNINVMDPYTGIVRKSTKADLVATTRLCDALTEVSIYSRAVYPLDRPSKVLHLHTAEACFNNTPKHCFHGPESEWEMRKIIEMAEVAIGGAENLKKRKPLTFIASISSPLKLTKKFCEIVMASARFGFSTGVASMVMAGANLISGIGGLETGLTFDFGLAVLDDEIVRILENHKPEPLPNPDKPESN